MPAKKRKAYFNYWERKTSHQRKHSQLYPRLKTTGFQIQKPAKNNREA